MTSKVGRRRIGQAAAIVVVGVLLAAGGDGRGVTCRRRAVIPEATDL